MPLRHEHKPGFAPVPRMLLDAFLIASLTRSELLLALLIVRLTYGCQNAPFVELRLADLGILGIRPSHARECIDGLVAKGLLERKGKRNYRLSVNHSLHLSEPNEIKRQELLKFKVGEQLRNIEEALPKVTKSGSHKFPIPEPKTSKNRNVFVK